MSAIVPSKVLEATFREELAVLLAKHGAFLVKTNKPDELVGVYLESQWEQSDEVFAQVKRISYPMYFAIEESQNDSSCDDE